MSFVRWNGDPTFHFIVGIACTLFFAIHTFIHRKWLKATTKSYFANKIKPAIVGKYRINMLLLIVWGACIATGFLAVGYLVGGIEWMMVFGRIHGVIARIGLVLTAIHIFQHRAQIMLYINMKRGKQIEKPEPKKQTVISRQVKICLIHLVVHIALHVISIYLVIIYTAAHIWGHRKQIALLFSSLFKKRNPTYSYCHLS